MGVGGWVGVGGGGGWGGGGVYHLPRMRISFCMNLHWRGGGGLPLLTPPLPSGLFRGLDPPHPYIANIYSAHSSLGKYPC